MIKYLFHFILCLFVFNAAFAQKKAVIYYLKNSGKRVSTKDSADFTIMILPPDTGADKNLFVVKGFYPDGKIKLLTGSVTGSFPLKLQGSYIAFFYNGYKKEFKSFENGEPVGDAMEYYPNGKLYDIKTFTTDNKQLLKQCNDSTGTVLTQDGNGKWIKFTGDDFKKNYVEGDVKNGLEEGEWHGKENDSLDIVLEYENGYKKSSKTFDKAGKEVSAKIFTVVEMEPEFPGGFDAFYRFLQRNTHYPDAARMNHTSGRVIVNFVVEKDGSLTDVKVARGIGDGCDEEAVRVMKLSPRWNPGVQNGNAVRVAYSVPVSFFLQSN